MRTERALWWKTVVQGGIGMPRSQDQSGCVPTVKVTL